MNALEQLKTLIDAVSPGVPRLSGFEMRLHEEACDGFVLERGPAIVELIEAETRRREAIRDMQLNMLGSDAWWEAKKSGEAADVDSAVALKKLVSSS